MYEEKTLADLKVGDKVFYDGQYGRYEIVIIERLTPRQIVTTVGKFWKDRGYGVGGGDWNFTCIRILTPEREERVSLELLRQIANELRDKITVPRETDEIKQFIEAIKPYCKE